MRVVPRKSGVPSLVVLMTSLMLPFLVVLIPLYQTIAVPVFFTKLFKTFNWSFICCGRSNESITSSGNICPETSTSPFSFNLAPNPLLSSLPITPLATNASRSLRTLSARLCKSCAICSASLMVTSPFAFLTAKSFSKVPSPRSLQNPA